MGRKRSYALGAALDLDEDREHEFKSVIHAHDVANSITKHCRKYINAFLNTNGGTIYFGVEDDGTVSGLRLTRATRDAVRLAVDKTVSSFRPQVEPQLYTVVFTPVEGTQVEEHDGRSPRSYSRRRRSSILLSDFMEESDESGSERESRERERGRSPNRTASPGRGRQRWKPLPKARRRKSSFSDAEDNTVEEEGSNYVVEVHVSRGRAPVYFMSDNTAKMRLQGSIIDMDSSTVRARISDAWKDARSTVKNIPAVPDEFIGRQQDIDDISEFVFTCKEPCKVICLYGRPGVGKSALAYRIAANFRELFPHEEYVCNLYGADKEPLKVLDAMGIVIRSKWPDRHVSHDDTVVRSLYRSCFAGKRTILIVENASKAELVVPLIPRIHDCLVIVTSRPNLGLEIHLPGVLNKRLQELSPAEAVALLRQYVHVDEPEAMALAEKCGFLPLGIRIIGGLLMNKPNITPAMLLKKYSAGEDRAQLAGLVGVAQALDMVPEVEMDAMRSLCVCPGTFDGLAAAAMLARGYEESEDIMSELIQGSLIDYDTNTRRYSQNDLLRHYIYSKFLKDSNGIAQTVIQRFVHYYTGLLERIPGVCDPTDRVTSDRINFEAAFSYALEFGIEDELRRLAHGLYMYRFCLSHDARRNVVDFVRNRRLVPNGSDIDSHSADGDETESVNSTFDQLSISASPINSADVPPSPISSMTHSKPLLPTINLEPPIEAEELTIDDSGQLVSRDY